MATICDANTTGRLLSGMIQPSLSRLRQQLKDRVDQFLEPHLAVHPISYNEFLVDHVQETQGQRHKRSFDRAAWEVCENDTSTVKPRLYSDVHLKDLMDALLLNTKPNVREYTASLAADVAAAYYKVKSTNKTELAT